MSTTDTMPSGRDMGRQHALYRFFGSGGELLYIGISLNPGSRWKQHRDGKPWWGEVGKVTIEPQPDRGAALLAEREAIIAERPRYNVVHNTGASPMVRPPSKKRDSGEAVLRRTIDGMKRRQKIEILKSGGWQESYGTWSSPGGLYRDALFHDAVRTEVAWQLHVAWTLYGTNCDHNKCPWCCIRPNRRVHP